MKTYEHKHDAGRIVEAVQITETNAEEVAEWCGGEAGESSVEVLIEGGSSTKIANKGDYVVVDTEGSFHVRNATVFEAKYKLSENQDSELNFEVVEARYGDELNPGSNYDSGENEDADRLQ